MGSPTQDETAARGAARQHTNPIWEKEHHEMKKSILFTLMGALVLGLSGMAMAASTATQTVTYEVQAINAIAVSGSPATLTVSAATAGSSPTQVSDATTSYGITTNESSRKITAAINTNMPAGITLTIDLVAPTGGTSAGDVSLSTVAADAVTGISTLAESSKMITYKLSATIAAGVVASASKTVTLTITAGV